MKYYNVIKKDLNDKTISCISFTLLSAASYFIKAISEKDFNYLIVSGNTNDKIASDIIVAIKKSTEKELRMI